MQSIKKATQFFISSIARLSYHQRIRECVPESFAELVPLKPQARYKYEEEGSGKCKTYVLSSITK